MPNVTPQQATAWIQVGETIVEVVVKDAAALLAFLRTNSDADDTAQLQSNIAKLDLAIAEEQAKAAGG